MRRASRSIIRPPASARRFDRARPMRSPSSSQRSDTTPMSDLNDRVGTIVDAKYEIQRLIGKGGMGAVYAARQLQLDRQVAIKLLRSDVTADEAAVARFHREARAMARIEHPN